MRPFRWDSHCVSRTKGIRVSLSFEYIEKRVILSFIKIGIGLNVYLDAILFSCQININRTNTILGLNYERYGFLINFYLLIIFHLRK